ncbi:cell division cycle-associated 7-like protein isoform X4 [Artibeus jamaicensis]|uniref:cell division cycle-associated 7-like protein isoform X4 n=1 Tax=Artibeus jamaicensis TaxID=9417 RepID=UPI00235B2A1D|nr:cell division cycle-associated 7-like protein isoform X4 [Artibeus jamaicensis]
MLVSSTSLSGIGWELWSIISLVWNCISKEVSDIFNAPSDDEEFVGFQDDVPTETRPLEESCNSLGSLESGRQQSVPFRSKYFTEELRRIFVEDTDSEDFEGFTQSDLNVNSVSDVKFEESDLGDDGKALAVNEEAEDDEEEKATPRRSRPRRSSIGLRVALQFPTKKSTKKMDKNDSSEPLFSSSHLPDNKKNSLGRKRSYEEGEEREDSASECEDEGQENSDALLRRAMNIKENKAMLAQLLAELNSVPDFFPVRTPNSASKRKTVRRAFSEGQVTRRMNPTRSARPPEKFALENFTVSTSKFADEFYGFRRRKTISGGRCQGTRRRHRLSPFRAVEDITEEDLGNVALTVRDKIYDKVLAPCSASDALRCFSGPRTKRAYRLLRVPWLVAERQRPPILREGQCVFGHLGMCMAACGLGAIAL